MTNRLTQDPLGNLFSIIRQRNGFNRNPTARTFRCCFGNICSYSLMKCSNKCNYEKDDDEYLNVDVLKECLIDRPNPDLIETDLDEEQNNLVSHNSSKTSSLSLGRAHIVYEFVSYENVRILVVRIDCAH